MHLDGVFIRWPVPVGGLTDDLTDGLNEGPAEDLAEAPRAGVLWRARRGRLLLEIPEVARYLVSDGNLIQIELCPRSSTAEVWRFLQMTPAAALYLQRGIPVLHAAVAADGAGRAVVLAGGSGAGKSVLLAELLQRGWGLLADDLAPVTLSQDRVPVALPTGPQVILWPDSLGQLAGPAEAGDPPGVAATGPSGLRRTVTRADRYVRGGTADQRDLVAQRAQFCPHRSLRRARRGPLRRTGRAGLPPADRRRPAGPGQLPGHRRRRRRGCHPDPPAHPAARPVDRRRASGHCY